MVILHSEYHNLSERKPTSFPVIFQAFNSIKLRIYAIELVIIEYTQSEIDLYGLLDNKSGQEIGAYITNPIFVSNQLMLDKNSEPKYVVMLPVRLQLLVVQNTLFYFPFGGLGGCGFLEVGN